MNKLKKFFNETGAKQSDLAEAADCHPSTVTRLMEGGIPDPRVSVAVAVEKFTNGRIKCQDWPLK